MSTERRFKILCNEWMEWIQSAAPLVNYMHKRHWENVGLSVLSMSGVHGRNSFRCHLECPLCIAFMRFMARTRVFLILIISLAWNAEKKRSARVFFLMRAQSICFTSSPHSLRVFWSVLMPKHVSKFTMSSLIVTKHRTSLLFFFMYCVRTDLYGYSKKFVGKLSNYDSPFWTWLGLMGTSWMTYSTIQARQVR